MGRWQVKPPAAFADCADTVERHGKGPVHISIRARSFQALVQQRPAPCLSRFLTIPCVLQALEGCGGPAGVVLQFVGPQVPSELHNRTETLAEGLSATFWRVRDVDVDCACPLRSFGCEEWGGCLLSCITGHRHWRTGSSQPLEGERRGHGLCMPAAFTRVGAVGVNAFRAAQQDRNADGQAQRDLQEGERHGTWTVHAFCVHLGGSNGVACLLSYT